MKDNELTPWFPASVKPARNGFYQVMMVASAAWSYWDGLKWGFACWSKKDAIRHKHKESPTQDKQWRGLSKKP